MNEESLGWDPARDTRASNERSLARTRAHCAHMGNMYTRTLR